MLKRCCQLLILLAVALSVDAQDDQITLTINDSRPLSLAKDIASRTHTIITFEEIALEYPGDLQEYRYKALTTLSPKYGRFNFSYSPDTSVPDILDALLEKYHAKFPGRYKIIRSSSNIFHIVPDASKGVHGVLVPRASILDLPVTVHMTKATGDEVACEVLRQVAEHWSLRIGCSTGLSQYVFDRYYDEYDVEGISARDHLTRLMQDASTHPSWEILRSWDGAYGANFFPQQWTP